MQKYTHSYAFPTSTKAHMASHLIIAGRARSHLTALDFETHVKKSFVIDYLGLFTNNMVLGFIPLTMLILSL